jgi:hypothetical protein
MMMMMKKKKKKKKKETSKMSKRQHDDQDSDDDYNLANYPHCIRYDEDPDADVEIIAPELKEGDDDIMTPASRQRHFHLCPQHGANMESRATADSLLSCVIQLWQEMSNCLSIKTSFDEYKDCKAALPV